MNTAKKITVVRKEPGNLPEIAEIENTLETVQREVGGYIETVTIANDCVIICNEEGLINGEKFNVNFLGLQFFGTILISGREKDIFASLTPKILALFMKELTECERRTQEGRINQNN